MLVNTLKQFNKVLDKLEQCSRLTVDVETNGLKPYHGDRICGIAIRGQGESYYFPFRHGQGTNLPLELLARFAPLLSDPNKVYIGFNYKFDLQFLAVDGIPLPKYIEEVLAAAHLCNENEGKKLSKKDKEEFKIQGWTPPSFKLKYLASKYLYNEAAAESDLLVEKILAAGYTKSREEAKGLMWMLDPIDVEPYACRDVDLTEELHEFYKEPLAIWHLDTIYRELCEYHLITTRMEMRGIVINMELLEQYAAEAEPKRVATLEKLQQMAGYEINPNSPKQLQALLGLPSTAKEVLEDILDSESEDETRKEFVQTLVDYRGWKTVNGSYYTPIKAEVGHDGFIHPNLSLIGTISGRLSCYSPNLQGIAKRSEVYKVKDIFEARPGYTLVSCDYSGAEARLAAHYMEETIELVLEGLQQELATCTNAKRIKQIAKDIKRLAKPYEETLAYLLINGFNLHTETQKAVFGTSDKSLPDYDYSKRTNFSVIYGVGAQTLSERLRVEVKRAAEILRKYHAQYPGYRLIYNFYQKLAEEMGYIRMWTGRVRHYGTGIEPHKASSNLIQGGVAELMREAILRLARWIDMMEYDIHMLLQIHDQIIFEVPNELVQEVLPYIKFLMEYFPIFRVPPKIDIKVGPVWGTLVSQEVPEERQVIDLSLIEQLKGAA